MAASPTTNSVRRLIEEQGYAVVPTGIDRAALDAVVADLWEHLGADPADPRTWYREGIVSHAGMMEMYHYQSMWDIRQDPRLYDVFRAVHGTDRLWVSIDRVAMKLPARPEHPGSDGRLRLHWDTDINRYPNVPFHVQGVLALADTPVEMGGFECAPDVYRRLDEVIGRQPKGEELSRSPDLSDYEAVPVPLRAGDILIWTSLLPHGNGVNRSDQPRFAQYISMNPASGDEATRRRRIEGWEQNRPPGRPSVFPGDPRHIEEGRPGPATLTPLGRRLLGVDLWPD